MKFGLLFLMPLFVVFSCHGPKAVSDETTETLKEENPMKCRALLDWEIGKMLPDGHLELECRSARLEQGCLIAEVSYSGCGDEEVEVYWNGVMTRSIPPQITLQALILEPGLCDRWVTKEVRVDVSAILENDEEVIVHLVGLDEMISIKRN